MPVLSSAQRNHLEKAVIRARNLAVEGAGNALRNLAVNEKAFFQSMSADKRALRIDLRNKARLLGDKKENDSTHGIKHLAYELAYDYWHKMLFARFLEANNLLIHPKYKTAVTLEECEEMAAADGYVDKWTAAAHYASEMLPEIFRAQDPLMQVEFSPEDRIKLEKILDELETEIFIADDSLGWVYQFWQSEAKAIINQSGEKINGEKLPAVTQLFTEPYMVHFLIDNTIGAWWVSHHPDEESPVKFEYLRFLPSPEENNSASPSPSGEGVRRTDEVERSGVRTAAGSFDGFPQHIKDLTILDPCMGSGHFLVALFLVIVRLRMQEEKISREEAANKTIAENLHGLELDARCTQIAAFNLALAAWKFCEKYFTLPEMNLACSGLAPEGKLEEWLKLVRSEKNAEKKSKLENGIRELYKLFQQAPELGSLIDPSTIESNLLTASFEELQPMLQQALEKENDNEQIERGVIALGINKAAKILSHKFHLTITNVPYLGKKKFGTVLSNFASNHYPDAKGDLATVFLERLFQSADNFGLVCSVVPHNLLFLGTYKKYRERFLKTRSVNFIVRLGEHAFENSAAAGAFAAMVAIFKKAPNKSHVFFGINASNNRGERPIYAAEKSGLIKTSVVKLINQQSQLSNPDYVISFDSAGEKFDLLSKFADSLQGAHTLDIERFRLNFWEIIKMISWSYHSSSPDGKSHFSGYNYVSFKRDYNNEFGKLIRQIENDPNETRSVAWMAGKLAWGQKGVACAWMGKLPSSIYLGQIFDNSVAVILPKKEEYLQAIYAFVSSKDYYTEIRKINQKTQVTNSTLVKVPFDLAYWQKVAEEKFPYGLPKPYTDDCTQWLFHGNPIRAEHPLQVAVARLLGYRFPAESDDEMELDDEARGLAIMIKMSDRYTDDDGIICIPPVKQEMAAAEQLREYLKNVFEDSWDNTTIEKLLLKEGSKKNNLEDYLREEFFEQHCKLFHQRPFIWHIWDGSKYGFAALVNYHTLTKEKLERLIFVYLNDWIQNCENKLRARESGAEGLLIAAKKLKENLELILAGEEPYDIFVRWKTLAQQPIGWEPDLNDGVRLNIRPFMQADVLRKKPNIKWGIDRGKNPVGSPHGEIRDNDLNFTLEKKRIARSQAKQMNAVG